MRFCKDGNACPQRAQFIRDHLETLVVERMERPSNSPDLRPIEHSCVQPGLAVGPRVSHTAMLADERQLQVEELDALCGQH